MVGLGKRVCRYIRMTGLMGVSGAWLPVDYGSRFGALKQGVGFEWGYMLVNL